MVLAAGETDSPVQRRTISLDEAITLARVQSVDAAVALNELKTAYWEYRICLHTTRTTTPTSRKTVHIHLSETTICR